MRKVIFALFLFVGISSQAQNLQVMYDFGNGRKNVTSTLEMFKPDKWGDTFFFVDMEFNGGPDKQPSLAYMEIARCLKFWDAPLSLHLEYNGGLLLAGPVGFPINSAYLAGIDYGWHDASFSKFLNLKVLYKNIVGKNSNSFQYRKHRLFLLNKNSFFDLLIPAIIYHLIACLCTLSKSS